MFTLDLNTANCYHALFYCTTIISLQMQKRSHCQLTAVENPESLYSFKKS